MSDSNYGFGFRGLLKLINAELSSDTSDEVLRLTLTFDTLDTESGDPIRFSLTRAYDLELPYPWCVADLCEYAFQHELQEAVPALFEPPKHRPGALDRPEVAQNHARKSSHRYLIDRRTLRWDKEKQKLREIKPSW